MEYLCLVMGTFLVENRHEAEDCDEAFDALERAVTDSRASVRDDTLLCTCPHGSHGGALIVEAGQEDVVDELADRWDVGETTVREIRELDVGETA